MLKQYVVIIEGRPVKVYTADEKGVDTLNMRLRNGDADETDQARREQMERIKQKRKGQG